MDFKFLGTTRVCEIYCCISMHCNKANLKTVTRRSYLVAPRLLTSTVSIKAISKETAVTKFISCSCALLHFERNYFMFYVSFIGPCHSVSGTVYTRGKYGGSFSNMSAPVTTCIVQKSTRTNSSLAISLNVQNEFNRQKASIIFHCFLYLCWHSLKSKH